ncbi:MAG TPA: DUF2069 domain-containing protein [Oleiagrimonas sp.]|nr:DUF2069 domain-containing protein [Oleiagrimonas sp.]
MSATTTPPRVRHARHAGFAAWAALLVLELVWHLWLAPFDAPALALAIVPLLLPLLALRRPERALLWIGIIALFYFAHGVSDAWVSPAWRIPALIEMLLSVVVIGALGVGVQRRKSKPLPETPSAGA